jgi:hypothetical protein
MNLARMMAAAHVSGAPAGYAWLVLSRGQRMHERLHARRLPAQAHRRSDRARHGQQR